MSIKFPVWIFVLFLIAAACAPPAARRQVTQVNTSVPSPSAPTPTSVNVPKQKDLIFVEFFAGT